MRMHAHTCTHTHTQPVCFSFTRKQLILTKATEVEALDSKQSAVLSGIARHNRGDKEGRRQATVVAVVLKSERSGHVWGPRLCGHVSLKTDPSEGLKPEPYNSKTAILRNGRLKISK